MIIDFSIVDNFFLTVAGQVFARSKGFQLSTTSQTRTSLRQSRKNVASRYRKSNNLGRPGAEDGSTSNAQEKTTDLVARAIELLGATVEKFKLPK